MPKLIRSDNYCREGPGYDETLLCSDMTTEDAMMVAGWLNDRSLKLPADAYVPFFYKAEPDNYRLQKFEPF